MAMLDGIDPSKQMNAARAAFGKVTGLVTVRVLDKQIVGKTKAARAVLAPARNLPYASKLQYLAALVHLATEAHYTVGTRQGVDQYTVRIEMPPFKK